MSRPETTLQSIPRAVALLILAGVAGLFCDAAAARGGEPLDLARSEVPEDQLLDVSIRVFRALDARSKKQMERDKKLQRVYPDVRRSEARYMPYHLKATLERTGYWGAVRVVPEFSEGAHVLVEGTILQSFGDTLALRIHAEDATGDEWLQETYEIRLDSMPTLEEQASQTWDRDFFQPLYNEIANDLLKRRNKRSRPELAEIQDVARLRFAAKLAPDVFDGYLGRTRKGRWTLRRLPAEDDAMMGRVSDIRRRDDMFVDTLNQHYGRLYTEMSSPYDEWRHVANEELQAYRELRSKSRKRKALGVLAILGAVVLAEEGVISDGSAVGGILGGGLVFQSGSQKAQEAKIHLEALEELAGSFEADVEPIVMEVEGEVVRLQGSVEEQYEAWQDLLGKIFQEETGFPLTEEPMDGEEGSRTSSVR